MSLLHFRKFIKIKRYYIIIKLSKQLYNRFILGEKPSMNKHNRTKFSELSTTKYNNTKASSESERRSKKPSISIFTSTMIFNLKPKIKRSFQTQPNQTLTAKHRSLSHNGTQHGSQIHKQSKLNDLQNEQIDISLPKPGVLRPIKQLKIGKDKKTKYKKIQNVSSVKLRKNQCKLNTLETIIVDESYKNTSVKRNLTITSNKQSERLSSFSERNHLMKMQQYSSYLNEQKLYKRLCIYSKQATKSSIRIYRQDLQKLIIHRYGKDRITTFLDTQYIQDYESVLKTIKNILKFNAEEILVLSFLIMDQNCDGLITPEDLVNFIGAKNDKILTNPLLMQDLHQLMAYLKKRTNNGQSIVDAPSEQFELLSEESITLMKFRIFKFQKLKKKRDKEGGNRRKKLMVGNLHQMLFTLKEEQKQFNFMSKKKVNKNLNCIISFIMKANRNQKNPQQIKPLDFAINFQSFKQIFSNKIPKTYIDFLFLYGGIELPRLSYIPLDGSVLIKPTQLKGQVQEERGLDKIQYMIQGMRQFTRQSSRIYNSLIND